jgi:arylsulfate sulfotransferase
MRGHYWKGCDISHSAPSEEVQDWTHANSISIGPQGNILVSLRHLNQIISIAPDFKSIQWRLGGPGSDFSFPDPSDQFYHQHTASQLPNGNILLFDNGNTRPPEEGGMYSRALELELDFTTMETRKVWEYRHSPDRFARCCARVERLANGNTLVDFGNDDGGLTSVLVEADSQGNAVSVIEMSSLESNTQYRAYALDSINGEFTE